MFFVTSESLSIQSPKHIFQKGLLVFRVWLQATNAMHGVASYAEEVKALSEKGEWKAFNGAEGLTVTMDNVIQRIRIANNKRLSVDELQCRVRSFNDSGNNWKSKLDS